MEMTLPKISKGVLAYFISIGALGLAEYFALENVMCISLVMSIITSLLLVVTLLSYTISYCQKVFSKEKNTNTCD